MFFKMLKSDLRHKKSLNIIIFLFIIIASLLVFVSAVQIYVFAARDDINHRYCKTSDITVLYEYDPVHDKSGIPFIEEYINKCDDVTEYYKSGLVEIDTKKLTVSDNNVSNYFYTFMLCTQPHDADIVYDIDNKHFEVATSDIAVSYEFMNKTKAKIGDTIKLATDSGNTHEFTISHIFKDQIVIDFPRFIVSDEDFEMISAESDGIITIYHLFTGENEPFHIADELIDKCRGIEHDGYLYFTYRSIFSTDNIITFILSVFLSMISIVIIVIIIVTMRFTIISSMKDEEKEIGMLKALGVGSLRFRLLFAAKYITFTIVGGIIGSVPGLSCSRTVLDKFTPNLVFPESEQIVFIGSSAVLLLSAVLLICCVIFVHRINRITAIDALHGENHGERYGRSAAFFLHRTKRMNIPFYLALSDILGHLRHYLFLIVSYTLGIVIILSAFHIKNSVVSPEFMKYSDFEYNDFEFDFSSESLSERRSQNNNRFELNEELIGELKEKGIPVSYEIGNEDDIMLVDSRKIRCIAVYGDLDLSYLQLHGEGRLPVLANEVLLSYKTPHSLGIEVGDTVTLEIPEGSFNNMVSHDFIVTGFFDQMELNLTRAIIGKEYHNDFDENRFICNYRINAPQKEKPHYIEQMRKILGDDAILDPQEIAEDNLDNVVQVFTLLERFLTVTVLIILMLITMLYMNIFLADDKQSISLLRCIGYSKKNIHKWQMSKIILLFVISLAASEVISLTLSSLLISKLFELLTLTGFRFLIEPFDTFLLVPVLSASVVIITAYIKIRSVRDVSIHDISEE